MSIIVRNESRFRSRLSFSGSFLVAKTKLKIIEFQTLFGGQGVNSSAVEIQDDFIITFEKLKRRN